MSGVFLGTHFNTVWIEGLLNWSRLRLVNPEWNGVLNWMRWVTFSRVPKCEGPGAPSFEAGRDFGSKWTQKHQK